MTTKAAAASGARDRRGDLRIQRDRHDVRQAAAGAPSPTSRPRTPGITVKINDVDHNTFQENINNYLQGNPDDVFTWFAGYRMQFFAERGPDRRHQRRLADSTGVNDAFKTASTGEDGKQYFVPQSYYPWAVFYRKCVCARSTATRCRRLSTRWSPSPRR